MAIVQKIKEAPKSARFWKQFNLYLTFFWLALLPVAYFAGWLEQTTFVSVLSLVALVLASQSSWQSSRVEFKADVRDPDSDVEDLKNEL